MILCAIVDAVLIYLGAISVLAFLGIALGLWVPYVAGDG